jgi:hypothetical protein
MAYNEWVQLFGKSADDAKVRDAASRAEITKPLKIAREELSVRTDIKGEGTTIIFTDDSVLPGGGGVAGRPILSGLMMTLQSRNKKNIYKGPLPYDLKTEESQATVRARLGPPAQSNEDYQTDAWTIDGLEIAVSYTEDLKSIIQVSVSLPGSQ